jgi:hypothetical protein
MSAPTKSRKPGLGGPEVSRVIVRAPEKLAEAGQEPTFSAQGPGPSTAAIPEPALNIAFSSRVI